MCRLDCEMPWNCSAMEIRSLSESVVSMVMLLTAAPMKLLMVMGSRVTRLSFVSTARKKASWRWMRLKSLSPSYCHSPVVS